LGFETEYPVGRLPTIANLATSQTTRRIVATQTGRHRSAASPAIMAQAATTIEAGTLSGEEVDRIIASCIAARSVQRERQRRIDWKAREDNAATFKINA
jgi:hypothetical protein